MNSALRLDSDIIKAAGCGKTFVAVNVARSLLAHGHNTLLLVCYTNHALDQIVEAILDCTVLWVARFSGFPENRALRIGGRRCAQYMPIVIVHAMLALSSKWCASTSHANKHSNVQPTEHFAVALAGSRAFDRMYPW
jgi:hypothetical protein